MVEHHVPDVGQVHALAERRGRHDALKRAGAECLLDASAVLAREARMVERDGMGELGHAFAKRARELGRLVTRVDIDHGLLPRRHDGNEAVLAGREVAVVLELEVLTDGLINDHTTGIKKPANLVRCASIGRRGHGKDRRAAQTLEHMRKLKVRAPLARPSPGGMMRFVHHDEAHAPRLGETLRVDGEKLRRGEHDVERSGRELGERSVARGLERLSREHRRANAEGGAGCDEVKGLIGHERAKRVHEHACTAVDHRFADGVHLEDERLAPPRAHDSERIHALPERLKRVALGAVRRRGPDKGVQKRARELVIGQLCQKGAARGALPGGRGLHAGWFFLRRCLRRRIAGWIRARLGPCMGIARRVAENILHHELGLHPTLPMLGNRLEHEVDHRIAGAHGIDLGDAEHDRRHARSTICRREAHMVAGFSHAEAIGHGHARRCKERHLVALTEGLEKRNLLDRLDIELRKAHRRGDLARVLEGLGRELREHSVEPIAEVVQPVGGKRHAHGARMPAKTGKQIGTALNGLEEVDRAHRAARSTCNAVLDREEERRHMVAVDDTARHDALHALVPALSPHDHHAAAGIGALNALECLVGEGRLDGPPFLVDLFELGCEAPGLDGIARE